MLRPHQLPPDASALALQPETCHCVADAELDNRYNVLRAEEHARKEGKCGPQWSTDVAYLEENAERNRYSSVVPWDHSRVQLPVVEGENDYINASWVELGSRTYIATQGPLRSTVHDFWQMVYAYGGDPAIIIMLTALHEHSVEKCAKYWPDSKSTPIVLPQERGFRFGLTITLEKYHVKNDQYKLATFVATPSDPKYPPKTIRHVYYHSWLDLSKPSADADIRALIHLVNNELRNPAAPQIVHCSAGIGRTGTFIAIDALLSRIDTGIMPAIMPRIVPLWMGDTKVLQYRVCPFTGEVDGPGSLAKSTQHMLSKFDIGTVSATSSVIEEVNEEEKGEPSSTKFGFGSDDSYSTAPTTTTIGGQTVKEEGFANGHQVHEEENHNKSSAKSGPVIKKVAAKITSVAPEVFSETPAKVDVLKWFSPDDPVMSTIRTMRKQRPKMVQGKQQLGYIYDQFEVGQQLARVNNNGSEPVALRRRSTVTSVPHFDSSPSARAQPSKPRKIFSFSHSASSRRPSVASDKSDSSSASTIHKSKLRSLFSGHALK